MMELIDEEKLAPLERGTVFEATCVTDINTTPLCILTQGQSFRGEIKELILLADDGNSAPVYVGSQGVCKFPLPHSIGIRLKHVYPQNLFFTGNGTPNLVLHIIGGGIV